MPERDGSQEAGNDACARAVLALQQIDGVQASAACITDASRISTGAVVQSTDSMTALDALLLVALSRGIEGHKVQVIVIDGVDFDTPFARLRAAAARLDLKVSRVTVQQDEVERRAAYAADIAVCSLLPLLQDRARDLLQWPLRGTPSHRQFDRLYGRRSASRNRLLPVAASALIYQADRVLIDQLALRVTADQMGENGQNRPAGAVHAMSLFRSYSWLGGSTAAGTFALRDIEHLYGVRVYSIGVEPDSAELWPDHAAQCARLVTLVEGYKDHDVHIEVLQEPLYTALDQALDGDQGVASEGLEDCIRTVSGTRVWLHRERRALEDKISQHTDQGAVIITTSYDPAPGSVRRLQASVDPGNQHYWLDVYALDDPLLSRFMNPSLRRFLQRCWNPDLARLVAFWAAWVAKREERRQRRAFAEGLNMQRRRFAFAPHWGQRYE